jgi:hypothetical protein
MPPSDQGGALTFLSERLLQALEVAGSDGLSPEAIDALGIPMLGWRLNELRTAGHVIGEDRGWLFLVHSPDPGAGAASTGPSAPASSVPPAAGPSGAAGGPVDVAPSLFDGPLREAA